MDKEKREGVRIIIGRYVEGSPSVQKPTKTITLINKNVLQVYKKIKNLFRGGNGKKN